MARAALALAGLITLYLAAALAGGLIPGRSAEASAEQDAGVVTVYLLAGPIHYDFLLPLTDETRNAFAELEPGGIALHNPWAEWLLIGWGAREFYTTTGGYSDVSPGAVWRSFTGDEAVLRVDTAGPLRSKLDLPQLTLSASQYTQFLATIRDSFRRDAEGRPIVVETAGFGPSDRFFAANGRFDLFRTCNSWVGRTIRAAGLRFGVWTPTPYAVTLSLRWFQPD